MKNFLTKYFGILGLLIYIAFSAIVRIPVGLFLAVFVVLVMLLWNPITRTEYCPGWLNRLYDWYVGQ